MVFLTTMFERLLKMINSQLCQIFCLWQHVPVTLDTSNVHEIGVFSGLKNQIEGEITFRVDLQVMRAVLSNGAPYHFSELSPTPTILGMSRRVGQDQWSAHAQTGLN